MPVEPVIDELLVSATPFGVRTAAIAGGKVLAFNAESELSPGLLGNIYLAAQGRHGGTARFVAIGEDQNAFLHKTGKHGDDKPVVQVTRAAWNGKAPRVSAEPALAGRYVVYFPDGDGAKVAHRIGDEAERERLLSLSRDIAQDGGGMTIRSAAAGAAEEVIRAEAAQHRRQWAEICAKRARLAAPVLLARGPSLPERLIRDILPPAARILTDEKKMLARLSAYAEAWAPEFLSRLDVVSDALFERHDAAGALSSALAPEVPLAGGGRLIIEPTQALTAIDVDSGVRAGARQSALSAACAEAAAAAAREIRLRNLAGLIVIDFPTLAGADAGAALLAEMRAHMKDDPVAHKVTGISALGLMEITRRRGEAPILDALTEPRERHDGNGGYGGRQRRLDALAFDIAAQARIEVHAGARRVTLRVAPALAQLLRHFNGEAGNKGYSGFGDWLGIGVTVADEPTRRREEWAIEAA